MVGINETITAITNGVGLTTSEGAVETGSAQVENNDVPVENGHLENGNGFTVDGDGNVESEVKVPEVVNTTWRGKDLLEGELSVNPATRFRQLLARPGIVVRYLEWDLRH